MPHARLFVFSRPADNARQLDRVVAAPPADSYALSVDGHCFELTTPAFEHVAGQVFDHLQGELLYTDKPSGTRIAFLIPAAVDAERLAAAFDRVLELFIIRPRMAKATTRRTRLLAQALALRAMKGAARKKRA